MLQLRLFALGWPRLPGFGGLTAFRSRPYVSCGTERLINRLLKRSAPPDTGTALGVDSVAAGPPYLPRAPLRSILWSSPYVHEATLNLGQPRVAVTRAEFEAAFQSKIEREQARVNRRLRQLSAGQFARSREVQEQQIARYYWDPLDPSTCGIASSVVQRACAFPILPQLILTPHLIVDVLPVSPQEFSYRYGVTEEQFRALVDSGFVIPNLYYYYNNGWREYGRRRKLWNIALHDSARINAIWITSYLNTICDFSRHLIDAEEFLRRQLHSFTRHERREVELAMGGHVPSVDGLPRVFGQRLAYLEVLGEDTAAFRLLLDAIRRYWTTPGKRADALRILTPAKALFASRITAAYGGHEHLSQDNHDGIHSAAFAVATRLSHSRGVNAAIDRLEISSGRRPEIEFALHILREHTSNLLPRLPVPRHSTQERSQSCCILDNDAFITFMTFLGRDEIRERRLGSFLDAMLLQLLTEGVVSPSVHDFSFLLEDLESRLRSWPHLARLLERVAMLLYTGGGVLSKTPPDEDSVIMTGLLSNLGRAFELTAGKLRQRENCSYFMPRRMRILCSQWRRLRQTLAQ